MRGGLLLSRPLGIAGRRRGGKCLRPDLGRGGGNDPHRRTARPRRGNHRGGLTRLSLAPAARARRLRGGVRWAGCSRRIEHSRGQLESDRLCAVVRWSRLLQRCPHRLATGVGHVASARRKHLECCLTVVAPVRCRELVVRRGTPLRAGRDGARPRGYRPHDRG